MTEEATQEVAVETAAPEQDTTAPAQETVEQADPAQAGQTDEPAASEGADSAEEPKAKKEHWATKRINELTREKYEERAKLTALEKKLAELEQPKTQAPTERPVLTNFSTLDEYEAALLEWGKEQGKKEFESAYQQRQTQEAQAKNEARIRTQAEAARIKHPDFNDVVAPFAHVIDETPVLAQYALDSDIGGEMLYHLSKNPTMLFELQQSSPIAAMRQLISLEQKLKTPAPKSVTKAPEPIKTLGATEKAPFDPETADMEAYAKWRKEQSKKKG